MVPAEVPNSPVNMELEINDKVGMNQALKLDFKTNYTSGIS